MDLLTFEVGLPAVPADVDVVSQTFDVAVNGEARPTEVLAKDIVIMAVEVPQGSTVDLSLTHTDESGNVSAARTQTFVAVDTIAPDAPGDFGEIKLVSERTVPDVEPTPEA